MKTSRRLLVGIIFSFLALAASTDLLAADQKNDKSEDGVPGGWGFGGFFGQVSTAEPVPQGSIDIGPYVGFFEDANALFGRFAVGVISDMDVEVKSGVLDTEGSDDPQFMIGGGVKYRFLGRRQTSPDMAISGFFEFYDVGEDATVWNIGTGLIGSFPIRLSNNSDLTPYGRLSMRVERLTYGDGDTDFDIGLNVGTQYSPGQRVQFLGELQLDDQIGFIVGINFAVY